jgi:molybdate transport system substrate-binding protein
MARFRLRWQTLGQNIQPMNLPAKAAPWETSSRRIFFALLFLICSAVPSSGPAAEIVVFAAISLTDALNEIAPLYEKTSQDKLSFNFAGSNELARQIDAGAPADIFFSADEAKMDSLAKKGRLLPGSRQSLLGNTLVIIVPKNSSFAFSDPTQLADKSLVKKLALANPDAVPAGIYAKEYLVKIGIWDQLNSEIIPTENVRACLAAVESTNVDAGIVYRTDALTSQEVKVAYEVPAKSGPPISYPLAVLKDSPNQEAAKNVAHFLTSPEAARIFVKYGFTMLP